MAIRDFIYVVQVGGLWETGPSSKLGTVFTTGDARGEEAWDDMFEAKGWGRNGVGSVASYPRQVAAQWSYDKPAPSDSTLTFELVGTPAVRQSIRRAPLIMADARTAEVGLGDARLAKSVMANESVVYVSYSQPNRYAANGATPPESGHDLRNVLYVGDIIFLGLEACRVTSITPPAASTIGTRYTRDLFWAVGVERGRFGTITDTHILPDVSGHDYPLETDGRYRPSAIRTFNPTLPYFLQKDAVSGLYGQWVRVYRYERGVGWFSKSGEFEPSAGDDNAFYQGIVDTLHDSADMLQLVCTSTIRLLEETTVPLEYLNPPFQDAAYVMANTRVEEVTSIGEWSPIKKKYDRESQGTYPYVSLFREDYPDGFAPLPQKRLDEGELYLSHARESDPTLYVTSVDEMFDDEWNYALGSTHHRARGLLYGPGPDAFILATTNPNARTKYRGNLTDDIALQEVSTLAPPSRKSLRWSFNEVTNHLAPICTQIHNATPWAVAIWQCTPRIGFNSPSNGWTPATVDPPSFWGTRVPSSDEKGYVAVPVQRSLVLPQTPVEDLDEQWMGSLHDHLYMVGASYVTPKTALLQAMQSPVRDSETGEYLTRDWDPTRPAWRWSLTTSGSYISWDNWIATGTDRAFPVIAQPKQVFRAPYWQAGQCPLFPALVFLHPDMHGQYPWQFRRHTVITESALGAVGMVNAVNAVNSLAGYPPSEGELGYDVRYQVSDPVRYLAPELWVGRTLADMVFKDLYQAYAITTSIDTRGQLRFTRLTHRASSTEVITISDIRDADCTVSDSGYGGVTRITLSGYNPRDPVERESDGFGAFQNLPAEERRPSWPRDISITPTTDLGASPTRRENVLEITLDSPLFTRDPFESLSARPRPMDDSIVGWAARCWGYALDNLSKIGPTLTLVVDDSHRAQPGTWADVRIPGLPLAGGGITTPADYTNDSQDQPYIFGIVEERGDDWGAGTAELSIRLLGWEDSYVKWMGEQA